MFIYIGINHIENKKIVYIIYVCVLYLFIICIYKHIHVQYIFKKNINIIYIYIYIYILYQFIKILTWPYFLNIYYMCVYTAE